MGERDFSAFELLVGRMDARRKVRRLIELCKIKDREIEQALLGRLISEAKVHCGRQERRARGAMAGVAKMPPTDPTSSVITDQLTRARRRLLFGYGAICPKTCKIISFKRRCRGKVSP
jgi:hypothetical protein